MVTGIGFLVQNATILMIGSPFPPFAPADYVRVAGIFLVDLFLVVLFHALLAAAVPVAVLFLLIRAVAAVVRQVSRRSMSRWSPYFRTTPWITLTACYLALLWFTIYYNYPTATQRYVTAPIVSRCDQAPPRWSATDLLAPLRRVADCRSDSLRGIVLDQGRLSEGQEIYRNAVTLLLALALVIVFHPFSPITLPHRGSRRVPRAHTMSWYPLATLTFLSLAFLPAGYAILFRDKQAPLVRVAMALKDEAAPSRVLNNQWRDALRLQGAYLLFQSDKELWLWRWPKTIILPKEHVAKVEILPSEWIFEKPEG